MIYSIPLIKNCTVTSIILGATGAIKRITIETSLDQIDLSGLNLDNNAEIVINKIITWGDAAL